MLRLIVACSMLVLLLLLPGHVHRRALQLTFRYARCLLLLVLADAATAPAPAPVDVVVVVWATCNAKVFVMQVRSLLTTRLVEAAQGRGAFYVRGAFKWAKLTQSWQRVYGLRYGGNHANVARCNKN